MQQARRIAHISDLHFGVISKDPRQFFSKRWLGNMNLLFARKKNWAQAAIETLEHVLIEQKIDLVLFTGDATCTSRKEEFTLAAKFFKTLKDKGMEIIALPGNHDHYTRRAYRQRRFYSFFPSRLMDEGVFSHFCLRNHAVGVKKLLPNWWLIALDTALATPWVSSRGLFSKEIERHLLHALNEIPKEDHIVLANHFPFFQHEAPRKRLLRGDRLQQILNDHPQVTLYVHGHTHRRCLADLRPNGLPIIADCGSTGMGSPVYWNLIDLKPHELTIQHFESSSAAWSGGPPHTFKL